MDVELDVCIRQMRNSKDGERQQCLNFAIDVYDDVPGYLCSFECQTRTG